ncbi:MAG TPA: phosphatase PAP2 family protein [Gemmatimonadaceae bacterium]|jgi:membrane-associated phospholipid phosphatase
MSARNRFAIAVLLPLLSLSGVAVAQDSSLVFTQSAATTPSLTAPAQHGTPQKTFFTRHDLVATGIAAAVTGVFMHYDEKIADWWQSPHVQGSSSLHHTVDQLTRLNETPLTIASVLTYGVGRLSHSKTTADVGLHWTEALVLTDVICQAIRGPLGRARPRVSQEDPFSFHFGQGFTHFEYRAFPSIHAAVGFATAAALVGEIRERNQNASRYAAPILYAVAMIPGTTRMYLNQHWASDVVSGAFIGQLIGARVVRYAHTHKPNKLDRALLATNVAPNPGGGMMVVVDVQSLLSSR